MITYIMDYAKPEDLEYIRLVCFDSLPPINNLSVIKGRVFLG